MLNLLFSNPIAFFIFFPGLVIAITVHEFAHAFVADKLGDPTPRSQGRVTLNPLAHLDPLGTIAILLTRFGWGKPVMFDPYNLKEKQRDTALIALAGPTSNILLAKLISVALNFFQLGQLFTLVGIQLLYINLALAIFNLVPISPLDGEKILSALLPKELAFEYEQFMKRYGLFVLILLIFPLFGGVSPVSRLISPIISFLANALIQHPFY